MALWRWNLCRSEVKKLLSLVSTQGGISVGGGDHSDLTYSLQVVVGVSVVGWWAKKTLSWISRSSLMVVVVRLSVVCGGVQMNFIPRPRTDFANGGTIVFGVRT